MIENLTIKRFKSIRELSIPCRKVNLFIGAPDTGKTNILEALHFLSRLGWGLPLDHSLRLSQELGFDTLFYRQFFDHPIEISTRTFSLNAQLRGQASLDVEVHPFGQVSGLGFGSPSWTCHELDHIRFYSYASSELWTYATASKKSHEIITPPHGLNLMYISRHNEKVYEFLKETIATAGRKLRFDQNTKKFRISEVREDDIFDYNLEVLSDSLRRFFFYGSILMTSKNATLVLDEPDVYAFPPYPKHLGEMIANDESNQFFLTTHNPYFLAGVVEKTPTKDLAVFVCSRDDDRGTQAKQLSEKEIPVLIEKGASVFFNLDEFLNS